MARNESDREDLLAEAVALVRRLEGQCSSKTEPFVAGFRADGRFSLYLGADPVYHFLPDGRLRRAFVCGALYRSQGRTLAEMRRERTPSTTILRRHDLTESELHAFLTAMRNTLGALLQDMEEGRLHVLRQVPAEDESLLSDIRRQLQRIEQTPVKLAPPAPGKP